MNPEKKNGRFGTILAYSFVGIIALGFVMSAVYGVLSIEPREARVMAILAIVVIAFFIVVNKSNEKHWEKVVEEKVKEKSKIERKYWDERLESIRTINRLKEENKELRSKIDNR